VRPPVPDASAARSRRPSESHLTWRPDFAISRRSQSRPAPSVEVCWPAMRPRVAAGRLGFAVRPSTAAGSTGLNFPQARDDLVGHERLLRHGWCGIARRIVLLKVIAAGHGRCSNSEGRARETPPKLRRDEITAPSGTERVRPFPRLFLAGARPAGAATAGHLMARLPTVRVTRRGREAALPLAQFEQAPPESSPGRFLRGMNGRARSHAPPTARSVTNQNCQSCQGMCRNQ